MKNPTILISIYIILMMFMVKNMYLYTINQEIHAVNTKQNKDLHLVSVRLAAFKEGHISLE
jgi:hypothetical protein